MIVFFYESTEVSMKSRLSEYQYMYLNPISFSIYMLYYFTVN